MLLFFYDTETTGLPLFGEPSEDPRQPHLVQLGAALVDSETRQVEASIDLIVRPDGWEIPDEVAKVHGITTEKARRFGVPEYVALGAFIAMWQQAEKRVGHNEAFDARIVRIGLMRPGPAGTRIWSDEFADMWKAAPAECTCKMAEPLCQLPPTDKMVRAGFNNFKKPKLEEAYRHFFGHEMENAHNAMADVRACMDIYWAMKDGSTGILKPPVKISGEPIEGAGYA